MNCVHYFTRSWGPRAGIRIERGETFANKLLFPDKYDWQGCDAVQFDPEKLSGSATVGATRVGADGVLENYLAGTTASEIADCLDIDQAAVESILTFTAAKGLKATA